MRYLLAFLLPPAAVALCGDSARLLANVPLTACFWLPGVVHALVVVRRTEAAERAERLASVVLAREERRRRVSPRWRRLSAASR